MKLQFPGIHSIYTRSGVVCMTETQRSAMTISCKDADYIPKVNGAGDLFKLKDGTEVQTMHNGILVEKGGYYGDWMVEIILKLQGHHEPQEEKIFHELLKRIPSGATMIELGSHWAFYSLWFNKEIKNARNFCFEPDPNYLAGGKRNAKINNANLQFMHAAAGKSDLPILEFSPETMPGAKIKVPIMSVDEIVKQNQIKQIDILHMDIQGAELEALEGAIKSIEQKMIRFIFVSTHHHCISLDPLTHKKCLQLLKTHGANIIASHSVDESYSGDGLIVASFSEEDKDFKVEISHNHYGNSLFLETEEDLAALSKAYSKLYDAYYGTNTAILPKLYNLNLEDEIQLSSHKDLIALIDGWSAIEDWGVWTNGNMATFMISSVNLPEKFKIALEYIGFVTPNHTKQSYEIYITHGNKESSEALKLKIEQKFHWKCNVPEYLDKIELS